MSELLAFGNWSVGGFRFTIFLDAKAADARKIFTACFGEEPQSVTNQLKDMISVANWDSPSLMRRVECKPNRIDVHSSAKPSEQDVITNRFHVMGDITTVLEDVCRVGSAVCSIYPKVDRYAFGLTCLTPTNSAEESYDQLRKHLEINYLNHDSCRDFMLRINRLVGIPIKGVDVVVNRISSWASAVLVAGTQEAPQMQREYAFATQVELDINTHQSQQLSHLPGVGYSDILTALKTQTIETLTKGPSRL